MKTTQKILCGIIVFTLAGISGNAFAESLILTTMETELFPVSSCPNPDFPEVQCVRHIVQERDSLWSIARKYNTSVETLYELNPHLAGRKPKTRIFIFEELTIPYISFPESLLSLRIKKLQEEKSLYRQMMENRDEQIRQLWLLFGAAQSSLFAVEQVKNMYARGLIRLKEERGSLLNEIVEKNARIEELEGQAQALERTINAKDLTIAELERDKRDMLAFKDAFEEYSKTIAEKFIQARRELERLVKQNLALQNATNNLHGRLLGYDLENQRLRAALMEEQGKNQRLILLLEEKVKALEQELARKRSGLLPKEQFEFEHPPWK